MLNSVVSAHIPIETKKGQLLFLLHAFPELAAKGEEPPLALTFGMIQGQSSVLTRIHSECVTGDNFHSRRCDCGKQKDHAFETIAANQAGLFIYLRQEGRGIGIVEKLKAYNLQDQGFDTVDANLKLGHPVDKRSYEQAARIINYFNISSVVLMTNNPSKHKDLEKLKIHVTSVMPTPFFECSANTNYLLTKQNRLGHRWK